METTGEWREGTRPEMGVVRSSFGQCASHPDVPDDGEPQQGADEAKHRTAMVLSCVAGVPCADMCHMGLRIDQCPSQLRDSWGGVPAPLSSPWTADAIPNERRTLIERVITSLIITRFRLRGRCCQEGVFGTIPTRLSVRDS